MDELEKIEVLRERLGVSYREAKEALDDSGGDLVQALISLEEKGQRRWSDKLLDKGGEVVDQFKTYIKKGNRTKVKLKRGERTIAEFPATAGVIGIVAALASTPLAIAAGIGAAAAVANKVHLEIEKAGGESKVISLKRRKEDDQDSDVDF